MSSCTYKIAVIKIKSVIGAFLFATLRTENAVELNCGKLRSAELLGSQPTISAV